MENPTVPSVDSNSSKPVTAGTGLVASDPRLKSSSSGPSSSSGTPGPSVGLPDGVVVPLSINPSLLQGKLLDTLSRLPPALINEALVEYDEAAKSKKDQIRNHGAYLYGVIKRYKSVQERALKGEGSGVMPMGPDLTPTVIERLNKLVETGFCTEEEMNDKVKSKIRMLSEKDALFAIDELSSVERGQIRNFGSYFMGILNRYMRGDRDPDKGFSRPRSSNTYGRRDDRRYGDKGDYNRDYRRRRDDSPPRGRSYHRDRYGYSQYGPSDRRERSRDRYDDDPRSSAGRSDYRRNNSDQPHHRDSFRSSRYEDPRHQHAGQQQNQGTYNTTTSVVPPPPPPRVTAQPQMTGVVGGYNPHQQQPYAQQQSQPPQQQTQHVFQQVQPPQQQQAHVQPQAINQQAGVPGAYSSTSAPTVVPGAYGTSAPAGAPGAYASSSTPASVPGTYASSSTSTAVPTGYVASAPSAGYSQAPVAPGGVYNTVQQTVVGQQPGAGAQVTLQQGQAPSNFIGSPPGPAPTGNNWQGPGQQLPPDILGLADRAASAVQALASQNALRPPVSAPTTVAPPTIQQSSYYGSGGVSNPPRPSPVRVGRSTATLNELPAMVQLSIKNLQATGYVDGELDGGILGMIKDLPEPVALAALERFSSIDTSTMRNKAAYLAGILRRELEKRR